MNSPSPPPVPDPVRTAQAQQQMNQATAVTQTGLNAINQVTPQGNLTYSQDGSWPDGTPRFTATQSYSPEQQALYDQSSQTQRQLGQLAQDQTGRVSNYLSQPFDSSTLPTSGHVPDQARTLADTIPGTNTAIRSNYGPTDYSADRQNVENALYSRINPQLQRDRSDTETRLINSGVRPGTAAWDRAQDQLGRNANDARQQAVLAGGEEQSRLAGLAQNAAAFTNNAQQQEFGQNQAQTQQLNSTQQQRFANDLTVQQAQAAERDRSLREALTQRNQPLNEITALMSGSQVSQPNFTSTPTSGVAPTDFIGATNAATNANMNVYNQQNATNNAMLGGLFGLGSAGVSAFTSPFSSTSILGRSVLSDARAKTDIKRVGEMDSGLPIYSYRYKGNADNRVHFGLMAQHVEQVLPEAVAETPSGLKAVDYSAVAEALA